MSSDHPDNEPVSKVPATSTPEDDGVDISLIRWMLSLTPLERLEALERILDDLTELRDAR